MPSATSPSAASNLKRVMPIAAPHLLSDTDLSADELRALLRLAIEVKQTPAEYRQALAGRYIALLFEKPSLRTRMTFELAIKQLGGDPMEGDAFKKGQQVTVTVSDDRLNVSY